MEPSDSAADETPAGALADAGAAPATTSVDDRVEAEEADVSVEDDGISVDQWLSNDDRPAADEDEAGSTTKADADEDADADPDAKTEADAKTDTDDAAEQNEPAAEVATPDAADPSDEVPDAPTPPQPPTAAESSDAEDDDTDLDATVVLPIVEPNDSDTEASTDAGDDEKATSTEKAASTETETETDDDAKASAGTDGSDDSDAGSSADSDADEASSETESKSESDGGDDEASSDTASDKAETETPTDPDPTKVMPVASAEEAAVAAGGGGSIRKTLLIVGGVLVGCYLVLIAAWAVDAASHRDQAMRGVYIDDIDVGGADREELGSAVNALTNRLADEDLEVVVGSTTVETDPVTLGAVPDIDGLTDDALEARRGGFLLTRPLVWAAGLFSRETIPARYIIDPVVARQGSAEVVSPALDQPVEPEMEFNGRELALVPGSAGVTFDPETIVDLLPDAVAAGAPYQLEIPAENADPEIDDDEIEALTDELNGSTSEAITVRVLDKEVTVSPNSQRSWIRLDTSDGDVAWTIDEDAALDELRPLFPALGSEDQQARFEVVDGEPFILPAAETVVCCAAGAAERLAETIAAPLPVPADDDSDEEEAGADDEEQEPELRVAQLAPEITGFDEGVEELEALGIIEEVSTFTTNHPCCANRVRNIQRFADLTQGAIIRPGEEYSLNGAVGRRTTEKGFFPAGAIAQGNFEDQVGGGISQYATTFFNASFFAGLEFLEYQSHSIYISRYPRGREATMSWPRPDLRVLNNTPYGILVWNEYTPTSITVTFYSTKHLEVEALDRKRSSDRQCRIDITPRLITYEDGTTAEDSVFALYRPGEGLDCNGQSTTPEPEPQPQPDPEPEPEPEPEPDPEPDPGPDPDPGNGGGGGDGGDGGEVLP